MTILKILPLILGLTLSTGCSFNKMAVGTTSGLFYEATSGLQNERDWEFFKEGVAGNLQLLEGLHSIKSTDPDLLVTLVKGFSGYAFGVWETQYLEDQYKGKTSSVNKERAIHFYTRAVDYALEYFRESGISYIDLAKAMRKEKGLEALFSERLDADEMRDLEVVLFFANSLGGLINLQKSNMLIVSQLPIVKGSFDWVCSNSPKIQSGMCDLFYGTYQAGRPRMLGGNPEKGREIFERTIKDYPHNWLARIQYLQFYVIPMSDEDLYAEQKDRLQKFEEILEASKQFSPGKSKDKALLAPGVGVFQAIAIKRFNIIKKYESELF